MKDAANGVSIEYQHEMEKKSNTEKNASQLPLYSRDAVFIVSPNSWKRDFSPLKTPAVTGPL